MRGNLFTGASYLLRGLTMLPEPGIRGFVIVPLVANILLFGALATLLWSYVGGFAAVLTDFLPDWLGFITWIVWPLVWLAGGLLTGYISTLLVLLFTSPFHALLAEKVEERLTGQPVPALEGTLAALGEVPRAFLRELNKFAYYIPIALFVLIISFIPGLNVFSPLLWFILGAWMMSLQFLDYPMDNHRLPFSEVRNACASRRLTSMGFGGAVAFVSGIPLANLILIPAAVIGATLLWCEQFREQGLTE